MLTKTEAIVLHSFKLGDTKMVVDMFTRELGRLSFVVTLPKTQKGRLKKQYFQPLSLLDVEADIRPHRQLQHLNDVRILHPFVAIPFEPAKLSISLFVAEFLYYALRSEQQNQPLFDYVVSSVQWLDGRNDHVANFHLVFLMRLSRFLGFYPNLDNYVPGSIFDLRASTFSLYTPTHHDFLPAHEADKLQLMMRMDYPTMHLYRLNHTDRNRMLETALLYYRLHLPDFPELRSVAVLRELWD